MRGPIQLVVANGVRYLFAVQGHKDVLGDLVIRELNEAVAYRKELLTMFKEGG